MSKAPAYISAIAKELRTHYTLTEEDRADAIPETAPPVRDTVDALKGLIELLLPARRLRLCDKGQVFLDELETEVERIHYLLKCSVKEALPYRWLARAECSRSSEARVKLSATELEQELDSVLERFFGSLPGIRSMVIDDIQAAYEGDPAALSYAEVTLSYPGLLAIVSHRVAHTLYELQVPIIPRLMSEWTHNKTGVDIHPGAKIGNSFFIDHATGVVIGETARIGDNVKIYQGVTLGAKSFALDEDGNPVKQIQRHPTVEDRVVIYANATILGGDTVIGADSTIGGNVFITESVPAGSVVFRNEQQPVVKAKK